MKTWAKQPDLHACACWEFSFIRRDQWQNELLIDSSILIYSLWNFLGDPIVLEGTLRTTQSFGTLLLELGKCPLYWQRAIRMLDHGLKATLAWWWIRLRRLSVAQRWSCRGDYGRSRCLSEVWGQPHLGDNEDPRCPNKHSRMVYLKKNKGSRCLNITCKQSFKWRFVKGHMFAREKSNRNKIC